MDEFIKAFVWLINVSTSATNSEPLPDQDLLPVNKLISCIVFVSPVFDFFTPQSYDDHKPYSIDV
jgi:hypothetical protein